MSSGIPLGELIGAGGFASVYAVDGEPGLAVKVAHGADPAAAARLLREHDALAALAPPVAPRLVARGTLPGGRAYLVMERVPGRPLRDVLAAGPLPIARALALAGALARHLAAAHARGVIHGDVQPANVLVDG